MQLFDPKDPNPSLTEFLKYLGENSVITANEARELIGLEPVSDGDVPIGTYSYNQTKSHSHNRQGVLR